MRPPVRCGIRQGGRNSGALAPGIALNIKKACDDAYRSPGLSREADQARRMHSGVDRSSGGGSRGGSGR